MVEIRSGGDDGTANPILASFPSFPGMALRVLEMGVEKVLGDRPIVATVEDLVFEATEVMTTVPLAEFNETTSVVSKDDTMMVFGRFLRFPRLSGSKT